MRVTHPRKPPRAHADLSPPTFVQAPAIVDVQPGSFRVQLAVDEPAMVTITVTRKQGYLLGANESDVAFSTTVLVGAGDTTSINVEPVDPQSLYTVDITAEDTMQPPNVLSNPVRLSAATLPDTAPPVFAGPQPGVTGITDNSATLTLGLDEAGTVFYVLREAPASLDALTSADVVSGAIGVAGVAARGSMHVSVEEARLAVIRSVTLSDTLQSHTRYQLDYVARDARVPPNIQALVQSLTFTTTSGACWLRVTAWTSHTTDFRCAWLLVPRRLHGANLRSWVSHNVFGVRLVAYV